MIGKKARDVDTALPKALPDGIAIANGDLKLSAQLSRRVDMGVKKSFVLLYRGLLGESDEIGIGQVWADICVHHIGSHKDQLASALPDLTKDLPQGIRISSDAIPIGCAIVESVAHHAEVGLVSQHVPFHTASTARGGVSADSRINDINR